MRENYIKQVKRELDIPKKQKREVIRDLNDAFASAVEHGESERQVIERLGSPKDFADNIHEQFGIDCAARQKRKNLLHITIAAVIAVMAFFVSFLIRVSRAPQDVIGQADAMTSIQVEGTVMDPVIFFTLLGIVALAVVIALVVRYLRKK